MHWNHRVVNLKKKDGDEDWLSIQEAVSYTHLTLPTIYSV